MRALWVLCGLALFGSGVFAAPLELYGRLPAIDAVAVSPDGKLLALAVTNGEERRIVVQPVDSKAPLAVLKAGLQKVERVQWAGPKHIIITVKDVGHIAGVLSSKEETFLATDFNIETKVQRPLITAPYNGFNIVIGAPEVRILDGKPIVFAQGVSFIGGLTLFRVDLESGVQKVVTSGLEHAARYTVDDKGELFSAATYDATKGVWTARSWKGHWEDILKVTDVIEIPQVLGVSEDGASMMIGSYDDGVPTLHSVHLTGDKADLRLGAFDCVFLRNGSNRVIATRILSGDKEATTYFDAADVRIWKALENAYAPARVRVASNSDDHSVWALYVDSPTEGPAYAVVNLASKKGHFLGDEYLGLKPQDVAEVRPVNFNARDGLTLTGYLTLPHGKTPRGLPLVVITSNSLHGRFTPGFDWLAQGVASRGYAVLKVNSRGAVGFGSSFLSAGIGQMGRKMEDDLLDGVKALTDTGLVDKDKVCFVGAAYGGYASAWAATRPGVDIRCAIAINGFFDPKSYGQWRRDHYGVGGAGLERFMAYYSGEASRLGEISPLEHATDAHAPILIVEGDDAIDPSQSESQRYAGVLKRAAKPVEVVQLKALDSQLLSGAARLELLKTTTDFLEKNNPPT